MRQTKKTLINKIESLAIFKGKPLYIILIGIILSLLALFLVVFLILKVIAPQPRGYDDYFETIDQVMEVENNASEWSAVYQPLEQQLGTEFYENEVLGLSPGVRENMEGATDVQREMIGDVDLNNEQTRQMGGIATPAELAKYYDGNPRDPVAAAKVQAMIAQSQGLSYEQELGSALFVSE